MQIKLTTVLAAAAFLGTASCTISTVTKTVTGAVHTVRDAHQRKLDWWKHWFTTEKPDKKEEIEYPIYKIHKYKGIEIKPVKVIDEFHGPSYPPKDVYIHASDIHHGGDTHSKSHGHEEHPSPVYVPELHSSPWKATNEGWKWTKPFTSEQHTFHIQEPTNKKLLGKLKGLKKGWISSHYQEHYPKVGGSISAHEIPESPEIHFPGIHDLHIPEISHIPMAIPIHQTTTTVVEHHAPHHHEDRHSHGNYDIEYVNKHDSHDNEESHGLGHYGEDKHDHHYEHNEKEHEYEPYKHEHYEHDHKHYEHDHKHYDHDHKQEGSESVKYSTDDYSDKKSGKPQLFNSYGEPLPSDAYETKKVEVFVPAPSTVNSGKVVGDISQYLSTNKANVESS